MEGEGQRVKDAKKKMDKLLFLLQAKGKGKGKGEGKGKRKVDAISQ